MIKVLVIAAVALFGVHPAAKGVNLETYHLLHTNEVVKVEVNKVGYGADGMFMCKAMKHQKEFTHFPPRTVKGAVFICVVR